MDEKEIQLETQRFGFTTIDVLPFLKGYNYNDPVVKGYLHALRPSRIRISRGMVKCDARQWRVTIYISDDNKIEKISQEVTVGLYDDIEHGMDLNCRLKGINYK